jgi:pimeloyl-ACP methyl ester carboxylesterase
MFSIEETGNPSASTIVFLHGGGGAGWMWQPQEEALKNDYHLRKSSIKNH